MANRFSNDTIRIQTEDVPIAVTMNGIVSLSEDLNTTAIQPAGGNAYDDLHNVAQQTPEIAVTTECIKGILDNVSIHGLCLDGSGGLAGLQLYTQGHDHCGATGRTGVGTHRSAIMEEGRVVIETINATPGANATLTFRGHGASLDGTVEPIVWAYNASLPTVDAALKNKMWTLGKVVVGGVTIDRVTNVTINYNSVILKPATYGQIWPREVAVTKVPLSVTITTEDVSLTEPGTFTTTGLAVTHANTSIQFKKRADNGGLVSDATAEHLKATIAGTAYIRQVYTAGGAATGTATIGINSVDDGTNAPIVWDTAIAYVP